MAKGKGLGHSWWRFAVAIFFSSLFQSGGLVFSILARHGFPHPLLMQAIHKSTRKIGVR